MGVTTSLTSPFPRAALAAVYWRAAVILFTVPPDVGTMKMTVAVLNEPPYHHSSGQQPLQQNMGDRLDSCNSIGQTVPDKSRKGVREMS